MTRKYVKKLHKKSLLDEVEISKIIPKPMIVNYQDGEMVSQGIIVTINGKEYAEYRNEMGQVYREAL